MIRSTFKSKNRKTRNSQRQPITKLSGRKYVGLENLESRILMTGDILATLWEDANANGIKDPGENMLQGWTVYVDSNRNGAMDAGEPSGVTTIDGEAFFIGLADGSYALREIVQPGYAPTPGFSDTLEVPITPGVNYEARFPNVIPQVGTAQGSIWNDINHDGVRSVTEPGLANWSLFVDLNNNLIADPTDPTAVTDANGNYSIPGIPVGQYKIYETMQAGWEPTILHDLKADVIITAGGTATSSFGNFMPLAGSIHGTVWNDFNGDGIRAVGDVGIAGRTVFLDLNLNTTLDATEPSTVTDASGNYSFPFVTEGSYAVRTTLPAGWEISPGYDVKSDVNILAGSAAVANFANFQPVVGSIGGTVWNDANNDGIQQLPSEGGLSGWTVFADLNSNGVLDAGEQSAVTDVNGAYTLLGVPHGTRMIREVSKAGYIPTAPGTGAQLVTLLNGDNITGINFGNKTLQINSIGGTIFADTNKNGVRDAGEKGLDGITVFLDLNLNGLLDAGEPSMVTSKDLYYTPAVDESGTYMFAHLAAGDYQVVEIVPADQSSTPASERSHLVSLLPGQSNLNVNSANVYRPNEIHGVRFDDLNGDHIHDPTEPVIVGEPLYIDLNRNDVQDAGEPTTTSALDGSYSFTGMTPGAYVVREILQPGLVTTNPAVGGTLWPSGVSNPVIGNVSSTGISLSLSTGEVSHQSVSLTLPATGALTNMVDVFLLFDDTGSFTANSPIVRAAFPTIISQLQTALPGINLGFGVGRFEEYANFASEYATGRPFILNQPIVASTTTGFSTAIASALNRTTPGYGGDQPESLIEALYQTVTGRGFDGNNNGTTTDSGAAGLASTQLTPGGSGDVPAFSSYTADPANGGLPAEGTLGGAGFRTGALPIILAATDTGFNYQPKGETSITGINGVTLPLSSFTQTSRPTTPFSTGAGIQETVTGLNALGALVIGLGTNPDKTLDPRQDLSAISTMTGATNHSATIIPNGTPSPIAPGDPLYFQIASGFGASVANGVVSAIQNAVTNVAVNVTLKASDPTVHIVSLPGVINGLGAGATATFDVQFTGDGIPHRFDLQFVRDGTNVVLGSIPVVLGTPIPGNGYEFEDLKDGVIVQSVDFGSKASAIVLANAAPSFTAGANQIILEDAGNQVVAGWATSISAGPASEASQTVDFMVVNDNNALFSVQPTIAPDGTLSYTAAPNANGSTIVTVKIHDNGGIANGGIDTSAPQTFTINVTPVNDAPSFTAGLNQVVPQDAGAQIVTTWATSISAGPIDEATQTVDFVVTNDNNALFTVQPTIAADGSLSYTSAPGAIGSTIVTVQIHDNGGIANGGIDISAAQTFTITVNHVNHAPVAVNETYNAVRNTTLSVAAAAGVLLHATDVDLNPLTALLVTGPTNGSLTLNADGSLSYTPNLNYTGPDSFTYKANDGLLDSNIATVSLTVADATQIGSLTASPLVVNLGAKITLTALNVHAKAGNTLSKVDFYRDGNANGIYDAGIDPLIGTDASAVGGWTTTVTALPTWGVLGDSSFFALATDNTATSSPVVTAGAYINALPVVGAIVTSPLASLSTGTANITVLGVTDANVGSSIPAVQFFLDTDNNGKLDPAIDTLIATDTNAADGWSASYNFVNAPNGLMRFFVRAQDDKGAWSLPRATGVAVTQQPIVTTLTSSLDVVSKGQPVTLTANGVSDPDGTVAYVEFWLDRNNDGVIDPTDLRLGVDINGTDGWSSTILSSKLATGVNQLLARAVDNTRMVGLPAAATVTTDLPPTLGRLVASPAATTPDKSITLSATFLSADTTSVQFYLDNGDNVFTPADTLLGTDINGADGWNLPVSAAGLPLGKSVFFTQAVDAIGGLSAARTASATVTTAPQILGAFTASPNPVSRGQNLSLSVVNIVDDGSVASVSFYRDMNNDGQVTAADRLIGTDTNGADGWGVTVPSSNWALSAGINQLLAVPKDNLGVTGQPALTLVNIDPPPVVVVFAPSLAKPLQSQSLKLTVKATLDTTAVDLFIDNGDGLFDAATDTTIGSATLDAAGNWVYTIPGGTLPVGTVKLWARAFDGLGYSAGKALNLVVA